MSAVNIAVARLCLSRIYGTPTIEFSQMALARKFSASNIYIMFSSSNFMRSSSISADFSRCLFGYFLESPLVFASVSNQSYTSTLTLSSSTSVSYCTFTQCTSTNPGGAIYCATSGVTVSITYCIFNTCNSTSYGGAIYCSGSQATSSRNCFYGCKAIYTSSANWGSAFRFDSSTSICMYDTIIYCAKPASSYTTWDGAAIMVSSTASYSNVNFTLCQSSACGAIQANSASSSTMAYINFANISGSEAIGFFSYACSGSHNYFNIIGGSFSNAAFYISSSSYVISISNVYVYSYSGTLFTSSVQSFSTSGVVYVSSKKGLASIQAINTWLCADYTSIFSPSLEGLMAPLCAISLISVLCDV